ncbi:MULTISPECIES: transposase [Winogradskyella]|uniref:transposase n=1 Tax=Winogradskyella TaxID=286104 RepID=UPI0015CB5E5B|nr:MULTISPECIES: transposase [Winogradskyella]QNK78741.1 transposase [Winogradskyella sp. PAMC22761]QXP78234.1 transposase [Winogradskyella sp. HaHa_3_26]
MILKPLKIEDCPQFYTATILDWKKLLKPEKYKLIIIESLQFLVEEKRVEVYGYVIMDNHIHIIWKPMLLYSLKHTQLSFMKFTAQRIKQDLELHHKAVLKCFYVESKDRSYQFWKRNSLCVDLYSDKIIEQKLKYIHENPVKAGLCCNPEDYRFSSAKFYKEKGDEFCFISDFRL